MLRTDRSAENASTTPFKLTEQGVVMGLRPDVSEFVPKVLQLWRVKIIKFNKKPCSAHSLSFPIVMLTV